MSELLKPADVAQRLKVSIRQVYALVQQGHLQGTRIGTKTLRISAESVDNAIQKGRINAPS